MSNKYSRIVDSILAGRTLRESITWRNEAIEAANAIFEFLKRQGFKSVERDEDDLDVGCLYYKCLLDNYNFISITIYLVDEEIRIVPFDGMNKAINFGKESDLSLSSFKKVFKEVLVAAE